MVLYAYISVEKCHELGNKKKHVSLFMITASKRMKDPSEFMSCLIPNNVQRDCLTENVQSDRLSGKDH